MDEHPSRPAVGRRPRLVRGPAVAVLLLAPFLGETLSTSTPPLDLLLPWNLLLLSALYGSGALLCRELARRHRLGLPGLGLLAAAYAVYEEALVVGSWFDPGYQDDAGIGAYSRVWHTSLLLAAHLTAFHVAVSICCSVLIVERLFPGHRERAWAGRRGLVLAALALFVVVPLGYADTPRGPTGPVLAAAGLGLLLLAAALLPRRRPGRPGRERRWEPRLAGPVAFLGAAAHFVLVYAVPSTGLPWPVGVLVALVPIAAAALVLRPMTASGDAYGPVGLRIVTGILAFFVVLDAVVGLGGRYDLTVAAIGTALALRRLLRRDRPPP